MCHLCTGWPTPHGARRYFSVSWSRSYFCKDSAAKSYWCALRSPPRQRNWNLDQRSARAANTLVTKSQRDCCARFHFQDCSAIISGERMPETKFDLIVIGSGPAGQKGAICAAKLRKRVAVIDRTLMIGGVCVHTGTIPSKSVREAIFQLTGNAVRAFYGESYRGKNDITVQDLSFRVKAIVARETEVIRAQLKRNGVAVFQGTAQFADPHTIEVQGEAEKITIQGDHILVACGTRPARNAQIPFDDKRILDTDSISSMEGLPREIIVVGAGVVGLEYVSFLAALGIEVTLIDQRPTLLDFVDREIIEALAYHLRELRTVFRLGENVSRVGVDTQRDRVF